MFGVSQIKSSQNADVSGGAKVFTKVGQVKEVLESVEVKVCREKERGRRYI